MSRATVPDPRPFIARATWRFSKTTADWPNWKHWYAVQSQHADDPDFQRFLDLIRDEGYDARFEGSKYRYLRVDDFLYWVSRSLYAPGQNLNRRPPPTWQDSPSTSRERFPCDAEPEMPTKMPTTPASVVVRENEKPCRQGFSLWS